MSELLIAVLRFLQPGAAPAPVGHSLPALLFDPKNALGAAILSLGTGLLVWSAKQVYGLYATARDENRIRDELALKVAIDVKTRLESLPSVVSLEAEAALVDSIQNLDTPTHPFRGYVTISKDKNSYGAFDAVMHRFEPEVIQAFQNFVQSDALLDKQYSGLASDEFAALSTSRKIAATKLFFHTGRETLNFASRFLFVLSLDRRLGRLSSAIYGTDNAETRLRRFRAIEDIVLRHGGEDARRMLIALCDQTILSSDDGGKGTKQ